MKAIGTIEIENGLVIVNPTATINCISYLQRESLVIVDIHFEGDNLNFTASREFTFINESGKQLIKSDVMGMINNHDILKQFN